VFDILNEIEPWYRSGEEFAIAVVTRTWSSAPRMVGAAMAVSKNGEVIGSVSGGCVEGAVFETCQEVLIDRKPRLIQYGVSDDNAFAVGLTCGGTIELFVTLVSQNTNPEFNSIFNLVQERTPFSFVTIIESNNESVAIGTHWLSTNIASSNAESGPNLTNTLSRESVGIINSGKSRSLKIGHNGELNQNDLTVFFNVFSAPPKMLIFGAIDFASALCQLGKFLGYYVVVCDARGLFTTNKRFPTADEVVVDWPHRYLEKNPVDSRTVICVLTHDAKFDIPALTLALRSNAKYIGAMGSRRTHLDRLQKLRENGLTELELKRLRSPIGIDLNAHTPEETAVSIAAEIIADFWGGSKRSFSESDFLAIHRESLASETGEAPFTNQN
jgi:xanthine dehydrogenase accessory factor